jgi:hypothetical protein
MSSDDPIQDEINLPDWIVFVLIGVFLVGAVVVLFL